MVTPRWARRNPMPAIVIGVVGLLAIGVGQSIPNRHAVERDLTARAAPALLAAGVSGDVSFVGRDGTVRVTSAADVDRAGEIVRELTGVRVVDVAAPRTPASSGASGAPDALAAPAVSITVDGGRVALTGAVPSDATRSALVAGVQPPFGADRVDDRLTVDAGVGAAGLAGLGAVAGALGVDATAATVELRDNRIRLTGAVSSAAAKQAAVTAARTAIGAAGPVADELTVAQTPAASAPQAQQKLLALPPITFLSDSATLTPAGRAAVAQASTVLQANPGVNVRIEGHTDSVGSPEHNLALSRARAQQVRSTLQSLGVAAERMTSDGFGESRLKVPDTSAANQAINRRVEFIVQP
jgi:outer membrane protein OmpA-like peptidoglycan-associated protein